MAVVQPEGHRNWGERVALASLAVVIVLGSALLWIGVPDRGFWVAGRIAPDALKALLFALLAVPATMVALGWVLYRVSAPLRAAARGRAARPISARVALEPQRGARKRAPPQGRAAPDRRRDDSFRDHGPGAS